jgi:hypothetical protein
MKSRTEGQGQSSFFGKLLAEIRLTVYEMILCGGKETVIDAERFDKKDALMSRARQGCGTSILRNCRRV